jgi:hypothetical protein
MYQYVVVPTVQSFLRSIDADITTVEVEKTNGRFTPIRGASRLFGKGILGAMKCDEYSWGTKHTKEICII